MKELYMKEKLKKEISKRGGKARIRERRKTSALKTKERRSKRTKEKN